jgi:endo-1,4-beta-xylanase
MRTPSRSLLALAALGLVACGSPALRAQPEYAAKGPVTYAGREPGALWRKEALARIPLIREGDFTIRVLDAAGKPVPDASVRLVETRSGFLWGTAAPAARLVGDTPGDRRFRQVLLQLFNEVSLENGLKWPMWEGDYGSEFTRARTLAALRWLRAHHFYIRGHNLVWPGKGKDWKDLPESVVRLRGTPRQDQIPALVLAHIREETAATRGLTDEWDVLNEPWDHHALTDLFGEHLLVDWFWAAREGAPNEPLYLNDWGNQDLLSNTSHWRNTFQTARYLLDQGAPLSGIGLQCHMGPYPTPPENFLAALDLYAALKLPIRITEFDFATQDERLQADYTRDFLIAAFSHPAVVGVQVWGFWEKAHWRPQAAMFRADWSEKPSARVFESLVLGQWRTRLAAATGSDGDLRARGFYGDYTAVVESRGQRVEETFTLQKGEAPPTFVVRLP